MRTTFRFKKGVVMIELYEHQKLAIDRMHNGCILCGGVGSGKSRTALAYFFIKVCKGALVINKEGEYAPMKEPKDIYIITTARKRDTAEWSKECAPFMITSDTTKSESGVKLTVDSWNNITKYVDVKNAFFIFDEQRVVGKGTWVKSFIKITKQNEWIMLSATPGDTWMDYIPVFIANGFYKNRTEFIRKHVIFNRFVKFPKVDRYVNCGRLVKLRQSILVPMKYLKKTTQHNKDILVGYDKGKMELAVEGRWHVYEERPIQDVSELFYLTRRIVNSDQSRIDALKKLIAECPKSIIFYNFDYELEILRKVGEESGVEVGEWNGHKHEPIPNSGNWIYLVQYTAGAEGWNCIETNVIIFYSQNYSYKTMVQAAGRIDRANTPFSDLYYYHLKSESPIDRAISASLSRKENFNEKAFDVRYLA